jgi:hypothetical protein
MSEHQQTQQSRKPDSTFQKQAALTSQIPVSHPASIIQRARINPKSLTPADVLQLQRTIGNRAVGRLLSEIRNPSKVQQATVQRQEIPEEEEPLQGKMIETIQCQEIPEEEEPLQGKFKSNSERATCPSCSVLPIIQKQEIPDEEELQMKSVVQRQEIPEEEEPLQGKMIGTIQRQEIPEEEEPLQTKKENNTGMPDNLKAGVESLSGIDMSDVRVHYNSSKPADVGALAYTQGTNIHVAPGQERHLPHEAWHVVQQAQNRVKPIMQMKDVAVNDDVGLEWEADIMGEKMGRALQPYRSERTMHKKNLIFSARVIQKVGGPKIGFTYMETKEDNEYLIKYGQMKLKAAWREAREKRRRDKLREAQDIKDEARKFKEMREWEKKPKPRPPRPDKAVDSFTKYYYEQLIKDNRNKEKSMLCNTSVFNDGLLSLDSKNINYKCPNCKKPITIAILNEDKEAFIEKDVNPKSERIIFKKKGVDEKTQTEEPKEYIEDMFNVKTRRYAYVEKNYYQMMEFFMTNRMEGRYQTFMRSAGNVIPDILDKSDKSVALVKPQGDNKPRLTYRQMAVAHQKLGSGPQQRGVSLTSTPKVNATYVNTGENFRTDKGFRLKIDLARIPKNGPKLINHYAEGGVISQIHEKDYDTTRESGKSSKYPYKESSIHARELYLESLKPEWIVAIEYHETGNTTGSGAGSVTLKEGEDPNMSLIQSAKTEFGGDDYEQGFDYGLINNGVIPVVTYTEDWIKGCEGARLYCEGHQKGRDDWFVYGNLFDNPQSNFDAAIEHQDDNNKFDLYRYGFLHGRAGKPKITSHSQLPTILQMPVV